MAHVDVVNFGFNFQRLYIGRSLVFNPEEDDTLSSSGLQEYDAIGGDYFPDYTLFPLVVQPVILATDPDMSGLVGPTNKDVRINKNLANMRWTIRENGEPDLIATNASTDYEVVTTGDNLGRLSICRNIRPNKPLTIVFDADYQDPRNGETEKIHMSYTFECSVTIQQPVLKLDVSAFFQYNPAEGTDQVVNASIFSGDNPVPADKCHCTWQMRDNGVWVDFDKASVPIAQRRADMLFGTVSDDSLSLTLNMEYMGEVEVFRCLAFVGVDSDDVALKASQGESFDSKTFKIERSFPQFTAKVENTPRFIPRSQTVVYPKAVANFRSYRGGSDPQKSVKLQQEMRALWETAQGSGSSTPTYTTVAEGFTPEIKADKVHGVYGQQLRLKVEDRGPWKMTTDKDGLIITDGQGKIIMTR